eukprot:5910280-Lingulodinium_polyedra.AAC.1
MLCTATQPSTDEEAGCSRPGSRPRGTARSTARGPCTSTSSRAGTASQGRPPPCADLPPWRQACS